MIKKLVILILFSVLPFYFAPQVDAATYYVAPTGNDTTGTGTQASPFQTFAKGMSVLAAGDELKVVAGTYTERLLVTKSGTAGNPIKITADAGRPVIDLNFTDETPINVTGSYVEVTGFEVQEAQEVGGTNGRCINVSGQFVVINDIKVHDCKGHGVQVESANVTVQNLEIYQTNLAYSSRTASSGWGSGLKVRVGGDTIKLSNNKIYNNYGEGIAVTRGKNVTIEDNTVYDNYSVNIYIDNSLNTEVQRNLVYCTGNSAFSFLNGDRPAGIQLAEEFYEGWGAQLTNVVVQNNLVADCNYNIALFAGGADNSGMKNVKVVHNTLWGAKKTGISFDELPATTGTEIANNINHFDVGGKHAVIGSRDGINMHHNFWVNSAPDDWMLATGEGDKTGAVGLATTPSLPDTSSFMLGATSPAIDAGGTLSVAVPFDFANAARTGLGDSGAFEYGAQISPTVCQLADINQDDRVDLLDYSLLVANFFSSAPNPARADINSDGVVDIFDYSLLAAQLLQSC